MKEPLRFVEPPLVQGDLGHVVPAERIHDGVARLVHRLLGLTVESERLGPLPAEVGETAEHVLHTGGAGPVPDLLEERQRPLPVGWVMQESEVHPGPVEHLQGVGQGLFLVHGGGLDHGLLAPLHGPPVPPLFLAEASVPGQDMGPLPSGLIALDPVQDPQGAGDPAQGPGITVEPPLEPTELEQHPGLGHRVATAQSA